MAGWHERPPLQNQVMTKLSEYAQSNYQRIIERIFLEKHRHRLEQVHFDREDIVRVASELGIAVPKNLGDVVYNARYRSQFPESVASKAPKGKSWVILPAGRGKYCFVATQLTIVAPNPALAETKVPDATPAIIEMYALTDEQALLAKLRYNRLIDVFTGVTCYSLQSHLRTAVRDMGQVETDELYVGLDRRGVHYIVPVQAKGGRDKLNIVQIIQDSALCAEKFSSLVCRPVAAQFMEPTLIALFDFERAGASLAVATERHYRLVPAEEMSLEELERYGSRGEEPK